MRELINANGSAKMPGAQLLPNASHTVALVIQPVDKYGAEARIRTADLLITNQLLYH